MMVRLIYASRAVAPFASDEFAALLRQSREHNLEHGITGVLCCADDAFLQVLEGGRGPVNRVYNRIVGDPRHGDVQLLSYQDIAERRFASWSMGQVNLSRLNPAMVLKYSETTTLDPYALPGPVALALCEDLVATGSIAGP